MYSISEYNLLSIVSPILFNFVNLLLWCVLKLNFDGCQMIRDEQKGTRRLSIYNIKIKERKNSTVQNNDTDE